MNKAILGVMLTAGLVLGASTVSFAAGDGLDRNAGATGNSTFAGQHRNATRGAMMAPRMKGRHAMRHRHHRHHR